MGKSTIGTSRLIEIRFYGTVIWRLWSHFALATGYDHDRTAWSVKDFQDSHVIYARVKAFKDSIRDITETWTKAQKSEGWKLVWRWRMPRWHHNRSSQRKPGAIHGITKALSHYLLRPSKRCPKKNSTHPNTIWQISRSTVFLEQVRLGFGLPSLEDAHPHLHLQYSAVQANLLMSIL